MTDDLQPVIDAAVRGATPTPLTDGFSDGEIALYSIVLPDGASYEVIDTEEIVGKYRDQPRRKRGTVGVNTPASLAQYVNAHKGPGTELWSDWTGQRITAVLNDHDAGGPGWGDHRAVLTLRFTPEWRRWTDRNGKLFAQVPFAEHIEECLTDIAEPDGATILELVSTLQVFRQVDFKSGTRLQDGNTTFRYEETSAARAGQKGDIEIPAKFLLAIPIFEGMDPVAIEARLRWRLNDGQLTFGFILDRTDVAVREAVEQCIALVEEATSIVALRGTPRQ